jgi:hypothetical protein
MHFAGEFRWTTSLALISRCKPPMSRSTRARFKFKYVRAKIVPGCIVRPNSSSLKKHLCCHTGDMAQMQAREAV